MERVYPRVCGGTSGVHRHRPTPSGLSPRVRGNPGRTRTERRSTGSIPACAGEPHRGTRRTRTGEVYPRVCGGTLAFPAPWVSVHGLSPRVRGNPRPAKAGSSGYGSIPACAGEPHSSSTRRSLRPVYPRVCGGTRTDCGEKDCPRGLSPRVRGNRPTRPSRTAG